VSYPVEIIGHEGVTVGVALFLWQRLHEILFLSKLLLLFISVILLHECTLFIIKETQHFYTFSSPDPKD
jgi:hypothetical protein